MSTQLLIGISTSLALTAASFALTGPQEAPTEVRRLTLEDTLGPVSVVQDPPRAIWAGAALRVGRGEDMRHLDPATLGEVGAPAPEAVVRSKEPRARVIDGDVIYEAYDAEGNRERRALSETPEPESEAQLDPTGRRVAYVSDRDLFVVGVDGAERWQVTADGEARYDGELDWVYQEELYGRGDFRGHWWSPTGDALAFLSLDETEVPTFTVIDHVPVKPRENRGVVVEDTRYPKAGDPNPTARVGLARPEGSGGAVTWIDLSALPEDLLVVRVGWTPNGGRLLLTIQDRIQTWAKLLAVDPATGALETWITEESATWTNRPEPPHWLADGSFLWESERTGYRHLYRYSANGELQGAVTQGEWQVRNVERIDEEGGAVFFEGTAQSAIERSFYRAPLAGMGPDGAGLVHLTPERGTHSISFSPNGEWIIDRWSNMEAPMRARLASAIDGSTKLELGGGRIETDLALALPARLSIPARDGYPLDASLRLPAPAADGSAPPIFLSTYSGPDAPSVSDRFGVSAWPQFLVEQGFCYLQVNVRSASNRGQVHTGTCYKQLGVQELMDLEDAVDFVVANYGGDPERVAISGWSYGGFMSGYALTHSNRFALGFAGAGVHDWTLYDTIYTERYMSTPQLNPDGYAATSVIRSAGDLDGHLVLFHGTMDDNVHLQNSIQLIDELQRAGETSFELMLYPNARHGVGSPHKRHMEWRVLAQQFGLDHAAALAPEPEPEPEPAAGASGGAGVR